MIAVVGPGVGDIVEDLFAIQSVSVGDCEETYGPEGPFGVDVQAFSFAAAHVEGELAGYCEGVADLRLAGAEFAEDFRYRAGFDAAGKESVEVFRAGGYRD